MRWSYCVTLLALFAAPARGEEKREAFPDGTLLFLENCNSVVEWRSHSEVAHVALLFADGSEEWVYEATPGKVRRVPLGDYLAELSRLNRRRDDEQKIRVLALHPKPAYAPAEISKMRAYLDEQIGRRYSVKNYVRGKPYDGIHCAKLAATTLNQSGRYAFSGYHKFTPQALYELVLATHAPPEQLEIPQLANKEPWWLRTHRRVIAWLTWCRWSSREAWLFFW